MNIALITAGGAGVRMGSKTRPKQFIELDGKAIIVHTIEHFESHPLIDEIVVVCKADWLEHCQVLMDQHGISKCHLIAEGGATNQGSIYKGLCAIQEKFDRTDGTIVLIHDAVRPLVSHAPQMREMIDLSIETVRRYGSAVTTGTAFENVITVSADNTMSGMVPKQSCRIAKAPQSFFFRDLISVHTKAIQDELFSFQDSASLMYYYGHVIHTIKGPSGNYKLTEPLDYYICKALSEEKSNPWVLGTDNPASKISGKKG